MADTRKRPPPDPGAEPASPFERAVTDAVSGRVPRGGVARIAFSGGCDSMVLLDTARLALHHWLRVEAMHVHHGLSPNADAWARFCERVCADLEVPLTVERVSIDPWRALGVEAAARHARYRALLAPGADALLLAHHQDDQAETVLVQLLRGAGVAGLAGMPAVRTGAGAAVMRPFLGFSRAMLEQRARDRGLAWIEDESNDDVRFVRNRLRHRIMPMLAGIAPASTERLARSARHLGEAADLLAVLGREDRQMLARAERLDGPGLRALPPARAANVLRTWFLDAGLPMPRTSQVDEFLRQLRDIAADACVEVRCAGASLRAWRGGVHLVEDTPRAGECTMPWMAGAEIVLPDGSGVLAFEPVSGQGIAGRSLAGATLHVMRRSAGDRFRVHDGARGSRSVKNLFQGHGVPPWERMAWPMVHVRGAALAIPEIAIAADHAARPGETGWRVHWRPASRAAAMRAAAVLDVPANGVATGLAPRPA